MLGPEAAYLAATPLLMARVDEDPEAEARAEAEAEDGHKTLSTADSCFRTPSLSLLAAMKELVPVRPTWSIDEAPPDITPALTFLVSPCSERDAESFYEDEIDPFESVGARSAWPSRELLMNKTMANPEPSLRSAPRQASPSRPQPSPVQRPTKKPPSPPPPPPPPTYRYLPPEYFHARRSDNPKASTPAAPQVEPRAVSLPQPPPKDIHYTSRRSPPTNYCPIDVSRYERGYEGRSLDGLRPGMRPGPKFGVRTDTPTANTQHVPVRVPKLAVAPPQPAPPTTPPLGAPLDEPRTPSPANEIHVPPPLAAPAADHAFDPGPVARPWRGPRWVPPPSTTGEPAPALVPAPLAPHKRGVSPRGAPGHRTGIKRMATKKVPLPIPGVPPLDTSVSSLNSSSDTTPSSSTTTPSSAATTTLTVPSLGAQVRALRGRGGGHEHVPSMAEYLSLEQLENLWHAQDAFCGMGGPLLAPHGSGNGMANGGMATGRKRSSLLWRVNEEDPRSPLVPALPVHPAFRNDPQYMSAVV